MIVRSIYEEIREATGLSNEAQNLKVITRAVKLLANSGLVDPLVGTINIAVSGGYEIALPREVKSPIKVNIDGAPSFFRNRVFEFTLNTDGTETGEGVGSAWSDRGYSPIQISSAFPGTIGYQVSNAADNGKTCVIYGHDSSGREISATLVGALTSPTKSTLSFSDITRVSRAPTAYPCNLICGNSNTLIAQYYADETEPLYRVIRLTKAATTARILFERHSFDITSQDDFIPIRNEMAVIHACKAVRLYNADEYEKGQVVEAAAIKFLRDEQASLSRAIEVSQEEQGGATDYGINTRDSIVVGDIYDTACRIFGKVGRKRIFDYITTAVECLRNEAYWDAGVGVVDIWAPDRSEVVNGHGRNGTGLFTLPRFVETVISLNQSGSPSLPRNGWFEFHLNGSWEQDASDTGSWDHAGEVCLIQELDFDTNGKPVPTKVFALCDEAGDANKAVRIFGFEQLEDGREAEVWRAGQKGWLCPQKLTHATYPDTAPLFTRVTRITRAETVGFVSFYAIRAIIEPAAEVAESDITTGATTTPFAEQDITIDSASWTGVGLSLTAYATLNQGPGTLSLTIYSDAAKTNEIAGVSLDSPPSSFTISASGLAVSDWPGVTGFSLVLSGFSEVPDGISNIEIERVFVAHEDAIAFSLTPGNMLGYWYPDETEPKYLRIKTSSYNTKRLRVLYRKRDLKVSSLFDPIHLRSRLAIETTLRSLKLMESDPASAINLQAVAVNYLSKEKLNWSPNDTAVLQFDSSTMGGNTTNIH